MMQREQRCYLKGNRKVLLSLLGEQERLKVQRREFAQKKKKNPISKTG